MLRVDAIRLPYELESMFLVSTKNMDLRNRAFLQEPQNNPLVYKLIPILRMTLLSMILTVAHISTPGGPSS